MSEILELATHDIDLVTVDSYITDLAQSAPDDTSRLVHAWWNVLSDDHRTLYQQDTRANYIERHVPLAENTDLTLHCAYIGYIPEQTESSTGFIMQAAIIASDSSGMILSIEDRQLQNFDVAKDPFASLVLDYFMLHFSRRQHENTEYLTTGIAKL